MRPFNTTWQTSHAHFHPYPYPQPTRGRVRHASRPTGSIHNGILGFEPFFWSRCVWGNDMSASLKFLECSYAYMLRVGGWNDTDANHEYDRNAWRIWFSLEIEHCLISAMLFSQISAVTDLWGNWSHISLVLQTKRGILRNPYRKENHPLQNELYNFMMAHIEMMRRVFDDMSLWACWSLSKTWLCLDPPTVHFLYDLPIKPLKPPIPRDKGVASVVWRMSSCKWSGLLTWVAWPADPNNRRVGKETRSKRVWFLVWNGRV